ncbi:MAG: hypothetical protein Q4C64_04560 [Erysipelotrichia bacterium]|nr:hypothetical protein [Erysipelotrichia bacterium]
MRRFMKIIQMVLLYVFIAASVFGLISYFKHIKLLADIQYQLYIGAICLILAIVDLIVIYSQEKNEVNLEQAVQIEENNDENITEDEKMIYQLDEDNLPEENEITEEEVIEEQMEETSPNLPKEKPVLQAVQPQQISTKENIEDNEIVAEEKPVKINADLTETQIMYINQSDNSYINDQGLPQLIVTKELSKDKIASYEQIYRQQKELDAETQKQLDEEEKMYLQQEKYENIIHVLTIIIVLLVLANIVMGAYCLYLRMF